MVGADYIFPGCVAVVRFHYITPVLYWDGMGGEECDNEVCVGVDPRERFVE